MSKKLLFISNRLIGGGSERVLVTLANQFCEKGYEVSILSYRDGDTYPIHDSINMFSLHGENSKLKRILKIRNIVKVVKPDSIIAFEFFVNMQVILACFGLGVNLIISERNDPAKRGGDFGNKFVRNFLYRFTNVLVCQTPDAKAYFPPAIRKKTIIIANPVKSNLPEPWQGERKKEVVNFCRLEKQKNLLMLIDAFEIFHRKFPDYTLSIYGDGKEKNVIEAYIANSRISEKINLHASVSDIHERIVNNAMFVSSSDYEGLSNSMIEAMAIGLPVICTDCPCGGAKMMIQNEVNGLLVPVGDKDSLAQAMIRIVEDRTLAKKISSEATRVRQQLATERIVALWEELIV